MKIKTFSIGGVHPEENKLTHEVATKVAALPKQAIFPLGQHIGAPAKPVVQKGDKVKVGTMIAEAGGFVSAPIYSLNSLALKRETSLDRLKAAARPVILTPHPLEFSRLSGLTPETIAADRAGVASNFAKEYGVTLVLKGKGTVIAAPDGALAVNTTGGSGLAKGGSGDVLAGLTVSLLASGLSPFDAATIAVYLHGAAGDALSREYSALGVRPDDLPREISRQAARLYTARSGQ